MIKEQEQRDKEKNRNRQQQEVKIDDIRKGYGVVDKSIFIKQGGNSKEMDMPGNHGKGHDGSQIVKTVIVTTPCWCDIPHIIQIDQF